MKRRNLTTFLLLLAMLANTLVGGTQVNAMAPQAAAENTEDVVLRWNRVLSETLRVPGQQPALIVAARSYAMMHGAMFDAVNSVDGSYEPYLIDVPGTKNASIEAAAAQAAYDVLAALYPQRVEIFAAEYQASLEGVSPNRARPGIRAGRAAAAAMLAARTNDGWNIPPHPYTLDLTPGNWQPTPSAPAAFTHYPNVRPFALNSGFQFLPPPPPALTSAQYAADLNEIKAIGSAVSPTRTADQTQSALAWASVGNPVLVAVAWNEIARSLAVSQNTTTVENARLFALINFAHHDAFQTSFASKFHYGLWRPVTAIQRAGEDGNPATAADPNWASLIGNPPYPTYAGNMAAIGKANTETLARFFGRDDLPTQYTFPNGTTRSWPTLSALAEDVARSREYGGIHFHFDSVAGQSIGFNTSSYIFTNFLTPR